MSQRPLITAGALVELLDKREDGPTVLDVRWELGSGAMREEYLKGHLPGAAFVDLDVDLSDAPGAGGRHPLPRADTFAAAMRATGVRNRLPVVVYDGATSMSAARAWWLLRYFGHREVSVLDGGLAAWIDAGGPIEIGQPVIERGDFVAVSGGMPLLDADAAASLASHGVLIDARAPERFAGRHEPIDPVAGHVPGAVNRPTTLNVDGAGRFVDPHQLKDAFASLGVGPGVEVGAYCGSGVTAAHEVLALELAGYRAALYGGSWSEWITDPNRPVQIEA